MLRVVLVCAGLLGAGPTEAEGPSASEWGAYREASKRAGRDPDAHVKLAVWCEAHGLADERLGHLAAAVLADPSHAAARGMMGLVPFKGKWQKPEAVADRVKADAALAGALAEYNAKRSATPNTAEAQWKLGLWCEQKGLDAEAKAHFTAVVRLDPARDAAWKRLDYKKHGGRWMTDAQVSAAKADAAAQKKADKRWEADLAKWKAALCKPETRAEAEESLAGVNDPRAVPSVWKLFTRGDAKDQARAVQIFGQIDAPSSSRALAALAIFSVSADVRRAAGETLRRRDPREYLGPIVSLVGRPLKYEVRPVNGPGSTGILFVEGQRFNLQRLYNAPSLPPLPRIYADSVGFDPYTGSTYWAPPGLLSRLAPRVMWGQAVNAANPQAADDPQNVLAPVFNPPVIGLGRSGPIIDLTAGAIQRDMEIGANLVEVRRAALSAQQQLEQDVATIEGYNAMINETNGRVLPLLNDLTGQDLGADPTAWQKWWTDQQGLAFRESSTTKPTIVEEASIPYRPAWAGLIFERPGSSCFGAGTPVRTLTDLRPIEEVKTGDLVLAQDTATGALSFRPVLAAVHNPPAKTLRVALGDDAIVTTEIHRFWRAGRGWVMARDLKPGDSIRTAGGTAEVRSIEPGGVQPVFNLDVAEDRTFFVGESGALVHDQALPLLRASRFDAPPDLAASGR